MNLQGRLEALAGLAAELGARDVAADASALAERLHEGRFFVACVGQFKRGKSTLINALAERPIVPVGVVPVTSAITVIRHGAAARARLRFSDGRSEDVALERIASFVSEAENPGNAKGVAALEVFLPSPLLAPGMCLVDTPGIGSVFEGNTAVTQAFVPHVDAALVVLGADPPISGEELALVEQVARRVDELVVVLNKADRVPAADMVEARRFVLDLLSKRLGKVDLATFEVSAAEALTGAATRDWPALVQHLRSLAQGRGADLVDAAGARGVERVGGSLRSELFAQLDALTRPLAESERRLAELERAIADADRAVVELTPLFGSEEQRLARAFEASRAAFMAAHAPEAASALAAELERETAANLRHAGHEIAQRLARVQVDAFRAEFQPRAEAEYRKVTERFVHLANDFLARVQRSGAPGLERLPMTLDPQAGFRASSHFFFTELLTLTSVKPSQWLADRARTRTARRRATSRATAPYLRRLLETNTSRAVNDAIERVRESRRALEAEIRRQLRHTLETSRRAIEAARGHLAAGAEAVSAERARLEAAAARLDELLGR